METSKLAKIEQKPVIKVFKRKPCDSGKKEIISIKYFISIDEFIAPEITLPPINVSNKTGSNVF